MDVLLYQTPDNGEINVVDGEVEQSGGLETAAYLSLFGGNEDDPGGSDTTLTWWGNTVERDPVSRYRSETQYLISAIPALPQNLRRIEQAAKRDLQWFLDQNVASGLTVDATIPRLNTVRIVIRITAQGKESEFTFTENWKISK